MGCCMALQASEFAAIRYYRSREIKNGPGCIAFCCGTAQKDNKPSLGPTQYIRVVHKMAAPDDPRRVEIIKGPCVYEPNDPWAEISEIKDSIQLTQNHYIVVKDEITEQKKIESGPKNYFPGPFEVTSGVHSKLNLQPTEYIRVEDTLTGHVQVVTGPTLFTPKAFDKCSDVKEKQSLSQREYVFVTHKDTGHIDIVEGNATFAPGPYDDISEKKEKITLRNDEYVKIVDQNTGVIRVEKGTATVILRQFEETSGAKQKAIEVNDLTAVYIFDTQSGKFELITQPGMFFPAWNQQISEKREKIRLETNEVMVLIDKEGKYIYMKGNDDNTRSFFLPPYCKILEQMWSLELGNRTKKVTRFDLRPQSMEFEFLIRTRDGVELFLRLNFFWRITNVAQMINATHDPPHDICRHAQSQILGGISKVDQKEFMESFNEIIQNAVMTKEDIFYQERGVTLNQILITGRKCRDEETEKNFQEIIKAKTNCIKALVDQDNKNAVRISALKNEIEAERLEGQVIDVKRTFQRTQAEQDGAARGVEIAHMLDNLPRDFNPEQKLRIWQDMQNTKRVETVVTKVNNLVVKPEDVDMKIVNLDMKTNGSNFDEGKREHKKKLPVSVNVNA